MFPNVFEERLHQDPVPKKCDSLMCDKIKSVHNNLVSEDFSRLKGLSVLDLCF